MSSCNVKLAPVPALTQTVGPLFVPEIMPVPDTTLQWCVTVPPAGRTVEVDGTPQLVLGAYINIPITVAGQLRIVS